MSEYLWDTCAIAWSKNLPGIKKTCTRAVFSQLVKLKQNFENLSILLDSSRKKTYADPQLISFSKKGKIILTGDKELIKKIKKEKGRCQHVAKFWKNWHNHNPYVLR